MKKVAKFSKVSEAQFVKDWCSVTGCDKAEAARIYEQIVLPRRATVGSAGYDFFAPMPFSLTQNESILIPTGIRVAIHEGWVLQLFPRSGLGFRYRLQMDNTVGIIDSDYFSAENEGHIFIKMSNLNRAGHTLNIKAGEAFAQGILLPFGITEDDDAVEARTGGLGSTSKAGRA